jgi:Ca2+-binding EF-hand superfamily protein
MRVQILSIGVWFGLAAIACAQPPQSGAFGTGNGAQYGSPAMGGSDGPPPNAMFTAMDADGDGAISMRELRKAVVALKQLDADKDGKITQAEAMGGPQNPQAMIDRVMESDKDGDGKLSKSEVPRHLAQMLGGADTNGDGSIDRAELTNAMQNSQPHFGGPGGGGPGRFGGAGGLDGDPRPGGPNLSQYDRNGDGQLSADEVPTQLRGMLRGTDQNGDGKLDAQEVEAIQQRLNERVRGDRRLPPGVTVGPQGVTGKP